MTVNKLIHFFCEEISPQLKNKFRISAERIFNIETPRSKADEESDSVKDFFSVLFANPPSKLTGNLPDFVIQAGALTGIQQKDPDDIIEAILHSFNEA